MGQYVGRINSKGDVNSSPGAVSPSLFDILEGMKRIPMYNMRTMYVLCLGGGKRALMPSLGRFSIPSVVICFGTYVISYGPIIDLLL